MKAALFPAFSAADSGCKPSLAPKREVNNFGGRVDAQREPIADTVRNDEFALTADVKSRPITKQGGAKAELFIQHQLSSVRVTGKREWQLRIGRGVESVRMMGKQNRKCVGASLLE